MSMGIVVIVDDEIIIVNPMIRLLKKHFRHEHLDYELIGVQSPEKALEIIDQSESDLALVISDVMMSPMSGTEFVKAVQMNYPESLTIILTGYADPENFRKLNEQLELFSYEKKPWNNDRMIRTVRNALHSFRKNKLLNRYMPKEIINQVQELPTDEILEGTELEATILFFDFRSSTSLFSSAEMGAKKALQHLNSYFEKLLDILDKHDGILDKFMGDGLMALFGVPHPSKSPKKDARKAILAALEMKQAVFELNAASELPSLTFGIGISTGSVIAGNIGSPSRANYTVLGNDVNIASRLEKAARPLEDAILISETTYAYVKKHVKTRPYDPLPAIGERKAVAVFEVLELL